MDQKYQLLEKSIQNLPNLTPIIGIEIEFYLTQNGLQISNNYLIKNFIQLLAISINSLPIKIEKEQGAGQIEIKTKPYSHIKQLCLDLELAKKQIQEISSQLEIQANFSAQPFINDCANAMQINLSLINDQQKNLFSRNENQEESKILLYSIAGILNSLKNDIKIFAPNKEDYLRYNQEININLFKQRKYPAPTNISWGYNNRTTAIRIPNDLEKDRRIEFRIPSNNAKIHQTIEYLLIAVKKGIEIQKLPPAAIYGNAFDKEYNLENIQQEID